MSMLGGRPTAKRNTQQATAGIPSRVGTSVTNSLTTPAPRNGINQSSRNAISNLYTSSQSKVGPSKAVGSAGAASTAPRNAVPTKPSSNIHGTGSKSAEVKKPEQSLRKENLCKEALPSNFACQAAGAQVSGKIAQDGASTSGAGLPKPLAAMSTSAETPAKGPSGNSPKKATHHVPNPPTNPATIKAPATKQTEKPGTNVTSAPSDGKAPTSKNVVGNLLNEIKASNGGVGASDGATGKNLPANSTPGTSGHALGSPPIAKPTPASSSTPIPQNHSGSSEHATLAQKKSGQMNTSQDSTSTVAETRGQISQISAQDPAKPTHDKKTSPSSNVQVNVPATTDPAPEGIEPVSSDKATPSHVSAKVQAPKGHKYAALIPGTARLAPLSSSPKVSKPSPAPDPERETDKVLPEDRAEFETSTAISKPASPAKKLPVVQLKEVPIVPTSEPYFEFTIYEKMWSTTENESKGQTMEISGRITSLEHANARAEQRFAYISKEDAKYKKIQFSQWSNKRDINDCIAYQGTFAPLDFPRQKSHYRIWVERHVVCAIAATVQPPLQGTPFLSKTVYVLRLFKLVNDPKYTEPATAASHNDDANSASSHSSDSSSAPSSESDNDGPDSGKYAKKARLKQRQNQALARKSSTTRATTAAPPAPIRQHHPTPDTAEIFTALAYANRAARRLHIEMSHEKEPASATVTEQQREELRDLEEKVLDLEAKMAQANEDDACWRSQFSGCGSEEGQFEVVVERAILGGPRNA
jgi:hypothetical protein